MQGEVINPYTTRSPIMTVIPLYKKMFKKMSIRHQSQAINGPKDRSSHFLGSQNPLDGRCNDFKKVCDSRTVLKVPIDLSKIPVRKVKNQLQPNEKKV